MKKLFNKVFHKETELEKEEKIEQELIEETIQQQIDIKTTGIVIKYILEDIEDKVPQIYKICEFHNEILPTPGSIIWAPNSEETVLMPYKVLRYDYIEDPDIDKKLFNYVYIVVIDASNSDIMYTL